MALVVPTASIILAPIKARMSTFWYRLTQKMAVKMEKKRTTVSILDSHGVL